MYPVRFSIRCNDLATQFALIHSTNASFTSWLLSHSVKVNEKPNSHFPASRKIGLLYRFHISRKSKFCHEMRSMKITMLILYPLLCIFALALFYVFAIVFQTKADYNNNNHYYFKKKTTPTIPQLAKNEKKEKITRNEQQRKAGVSKSFVRNAVVLFHKVRNGKWNKYVLTIAMPSMCCAYFSFMPLSFAMLFSCVIGAV